MMTQGSRTAPLNALPVRRSGDAVAVRLALALLVTWACRPGSAGAPARGPGLTAAVRASVEDSVRALIRRNVNAVNDRNADAVSQLYPDSGATLSAGDGEVQLVSRDTLRARTTEYFASLRAITFSQSIERIDVLAAGAAVVTARIDLKQVDTAGRQSAARPLWTAALALRDGRYVVLQEHASDPEPR
jgi:uncharacterized protein (TIGR02246 family)